MACKEYEAFVPISLNMEPNVAPYRRNQETTIFQAKYDDVLPQLVEIDNFGRDIEDLYEQLQSSGLASRPSFQLNIRRS